MKNKERISLVVEFEKGNLPSFLCELNPKYVQLVHKRIDSIMKARTSAGVL